MINPDSQIKYTTIVEELIGQGAEGIILGCTEICMLIGDIKFSVPLFDTTTIHAKEAVNFALEQKRQPVLLLLVRYKYSSAFNLF